MTTVIEKFVAEVGWDIDPKGLQEFNKQAESVIKWGTRIAGVVSAAIGGFTALAAVVNENTSKNMQLAKSVGISAESLDAYSSILGRIGFEAENVVDLVEEMNNKLGELAGLGEMSSASDALKLLNLEFKTLKELAPEKQFETILSAALELEDTQVAVSAVDMLMGGEANKIVGYLRTYNMSLEDLLQRQKDLNLLTEDGRKGAERWAFVWNDLKTVTESLTAQISGLLGDALAPMVDELIDWVVQNKELIKTKLVEWIDRIVKGIKFMLAVGRGIKRFVDSVGGLANAFKLLAVTIAAVKLYQMAQAIQMIIVGMRGAAVATALFKTALMGLKTAGIVGLFVLAALALEDLYVALTGGESAFAPLHNAIGKFLAEDVAAWVAGLLGMDPHEMNLRIVEFFEETIPNAYNDFINFLGQGIENLVNMFLNLDNNVAIIFNGIYNSVVKWIGKAVDWIKTQLAKVPLLGKFFSGGGADINAGDILGGINTVATPLQSPLLAATQTAAGRGIGAMQNVNIAPTINVTQQPGESGENLANRVTQKLNEQAAKAVQNNDKGIVR